MADAVVCDEVGDGVALFGALDNRVDCVAPAVGEKDRAGLRANRNHVACAVVLFIFARALVLTNDVGVVLVYRTTSGKSGLFVIAHALAGDVKGLGWLGCGRRGAAQALVILFG